MVVFYFSGTGNTRVVAEMFSSKMHAKCYSVEKRTDFNKLVQENETITFCYPVYGSRVPRIMRQFVSFIQRSLEGKKIIVLCTQFLFSGDGARAFTDLLPPGYVKVLYAEHFFMPNNICNVFFLPVIENSKTRRYLSSAEIRIDHMVKDINDGVVKKRGFNIFSRLLGLTQGLYFYSLEKKCLNSVKVNENCTLCGYCESACPMHNLVLNGTAITQKSNCTLCYRCANNCPARAITIMFGKVKKQYKGLLRYVKDDKI